MMIYMLLFSMFQSEQACKVLLVPFLMQARRYVCHFQILNVLENMVCIVAVCTRTQECPQFARGNDQIHKWSCSTIIIILVVVNLQITTRRFQFLIVTWHNGNVIIIIMMTITTRLKFEKASRHCHGRLRCGQMRNGRRCRLFHQTHECRTRGGKERKSRFRTSRTFLYRSIDMLYFRRRQCHCRWRNGCLLLLLVLANSIIVTKFACRFLQRPLEWHPSVQDNSGTTLVLQKRRDFSFESNGK
mmetsp:Transcript_29177/g.52808  ORF Transcript_29177/g.52808 Transcript_29177/m.52808 type:complete len:244 (+) Transcript_29177:2356-3087(+)